MRPPAPPVPPAPPEHRGGDAAVADLCRRLFAAPDRLADALTHPVHGRFRIAPHHHRELLQFDLLLGCGGRCLVAGAWHDAQPVTLLVSYPGQRHGYELTERSRGEARVYHVKLRVGLGWPAVKRRVFHPVAGSGGVSPPALAEGLRQLVRGAVLRGARPAVLIAHLSSVLCQWPRREGSAPARPASASPAALDDLAPDLGGALRLIHDDPGRPPSLAELADAAAMSPRHFARRFKAAFGCTPHAYLTDRRFAHARELLLHDRLKVHQIAHRLGFSSAATFSRWFTQHAGTSPQAYRRDPAVM